MMLERGTPPATAHNTQLRAHSMHLSACLLALMGVVDGGGFRGGFMLGLSHVRNLHGFSGYA